MFASFRSIVATWGRLSRSRAALANPEPTPERPPDEGWLNDPVLSSLFSELRSGRTPPYSFDCTLVRINILPIMRPENDVPADEHFARINGFFTEVSHTVARYQGLIHGFVGDEVICYFKDEIVGNSVATAISAVRDIHAMASRYPFTVPSALAHGSLHFGRFVNDHNILGPILSETRQILTTVNEGNVLLFTERHAEAARAVCNTKLFVEATLKGFAQPQKVLVYAGHHDVMESLIQRPTSLSYYRSDDDLCALLSDARAAVDNERFAGAEATLAALRHTRVTLSSGRPGQVLIDWLENLLIEEERGEITFVPKFRLLASLVRLAEFLIPREHFDARLKTVLERATAVRIQRVAANAFEVLSFFQQDTDPNYLKSLIDHSNNRVAANAIIHQGRIDLSPQVIKRLKRMLSSRTSHQVASGLYALGQLAEYHRRRDLNYYQAASDFQELVCRLPEYARSNDMMIRRQALQASLKSENPDVLAQIPDLKLPMRRTS